MPSLTNRKWAEGAWIGNFFPALPQDAAKALKELLTLKSGTIIVSYDGTEYLARIITTKGGWSPMMLQNESEVFADAFNVILSILLVDGGCLMAWVASCFLVKPVTVLAEAAQSVAAGDLGAIPQNEAPFKAEVACCTAA